MAVREAKIKKPKIGGFVFNETKTVQMDGSLAQFLIEANIKILPLTGRPGSGKGTLAKLIALALAGYRTTIWKEMSKVLAQYRPDVIENYIHQGRLAPDDAVMDAFTQMVLKDIPPNSIVLMDGIPRTLGQAEAFDALGIPYTCIFLKAGRQDALDLIELRRLTGKRVDDADVAKNERRQDEYERLTVPAIDFMRTQATGNFIVVNPGRLEAKFRTIVPAFGLNGSTERVLFNIGQPKHPARQFIDEKDEEMRKFRHRRRHADGIRELVC